MSPKIKILLARGRCSFVAGLDKAGKPVKCPQKATVQIPKTNKKTKLSEYHPLCDHHAEIQMTTLYSRFVKIHRGGSNA
jgi:hypothetical protein